MSGRPARPGTIDEPGRDRNAFRSAGLRYPATAKREILSRAGSLPAPTAREGAREKVPPGRPSRPAWLPVFHRLGGRALLLSGARAGI